MPRGFAHFAASRSVPDGSAQPSPQRPAPIVRRRRPEPFPFAAEVTCSTQPPRAWAPRGCGSFEVLVSKRVIGCGRGPRWPRRREPRRSRHEWCTSREIAPVEEAADKKAGDVLCPGSFDIKLQRPPPRNREMQIGPMGVPLEPPPPRFVYKSFEEFQRIQDETARNLELPDTDDGMTAESAVLRISERNANYNMLDVEEIVSFDDDGYEALDWIVEEMQPRGHVSLGLLISWSVGEQLGLPREARSARAAELPVARLKNPTAKQFWPYVLRNQPVVITGGLDEKGFPPIRDFADFGYLGNRCGSRMVKVKSEVYKDACGREVFMSDPSNEMPLTEFLTRVTQSECSDKSPGCYMGKTDLQEFLPEMIEDLERSAAGPWQQFSKCFGPNPLKSHMYFGCHNNTTAIHCDLSENLLVVISGSKTFDLYPPSDADCLYVIKEPSYVHSSVPPFTDPKNMSEELAAKYPLYRHAQPQRVELKAGDMLYLPMFWWHGVTACRERNMIINWWSTVHPDKRGPQWNPDPGLEEGANRVCEAVRRANA